MYKVFFASITIVLTLISGCSAFSKLVYYSDVNQGNYLMPNDISKIHKGMTKNQVTYILGTPMMSDLFGTGTYFYVFRQQLGHKKVIQQILTLTFNNNGFLTKIDYKPSLSN